MKTEEKIKIYKIDSITFFEIPYNNEDITILNDALYLNLHSTRTFANIFGKSRHECNLNNLFPTVEIC